MDIAETVTEEFVEFAPEARVSKLVGAFDDPAVTGVVVRGDEFEGVVTRRQLATSHHQPAERVGSLVHHVPRLAPDEDVRKVARLMIESDSQLLPVFEGERLLGVVTADDVLRHVQSFLDAATVAQAATADLVSLSPDSTFGDALHTFREHHVTHLPVVEKGTAVGVLSLYDVAGLTVRAANRSQGGDPSDAASVGGGRSRGGFGAREGELDRVLDLPIRDLMTSPVRTIGRNETLAAAVSAMFAAGTSSLIVTADGRPDGIVTKTDVLDSLTWEAGGNRAVQVYGTDLLDDVSYDEVVAMVDKFDDHDSDLTVLDAKIHLHEHDETRRGTPLLLARMRLHTDRGLFVASGEGYGASHAINEARDVLERQLRDRKTRGRSKKRPDEEFWTKRFGWMMPEG
ncbi:CBS domain-containing protein [Haloplanus salinus]|jgi:CBS domain-containing protein/ribosome-associated translation inhibitor RaiA|uniref:CBS domain-containing protein n=1 Tax=Haloplanus salinus TaxID=1126245 RepID=A0A368NE52_9EURY|nr:CBS domain-containing protein [Haloplanus salinus]RCU47731.1 CBS domain-containing protein [Haloplanus salinus]